MKTRVGVIGATGYTGVELLRLLARHPGVEVTVLTSQKYAGQPIDRVFPSLAAHGFPACEEMSIEPVAEKVDFVFTAVPHKTAMETVPLFLARGKRVVDLSADFRFSDVTVYERWYQKHTAPELLAETVFGLPELHREKIRSARIVGNPGCYPTSAILGLTPLVGGGLVSLSNLISDSKSGVTGAGRDAVVDSLFCEVNEGVKAYKIFQHRHLAEIEGELSWVAGKKVVVTFVPHLIPMSRGILSTLYATLHQPMKLDELLQVYTDRYRDEPFVRVLPKGKLPCTRDVKGANFCDIGVQVNEEDGRVVVVSAIDNLTKGASGQAVQNMNIMLGFPETMGLDVVPLFP